MQLLRGTIPNIGKYKVTPCEHVGTKNGVHFDMERLSEERLSDCILHLPPPAAPISDEETLVVP